MATKRKTSRRIYPPIFKMEAIKRYYDNDSNNYKTAKELQIPEITLSKWVKKYGERVQNGDTLEDIFTVEQGVFSQATEEEIYRAKLNKDSEKYVKNPTEAKEKINAKALLVMETLIEKISAQIPVINVSNTKQMQEMASLIKTLNDIVKSTDKGIVGEEGDENGNGALGSIVKQLAQQYEKKTGKKVVGVSTENLKN